MRASKYTGKWHRHDQSDVDSTAAVADEADKGLTCVSFSPVTSVVESTLLWPGHIYRLYVTGNPSFEFGFFKL